MKGSFSVRRRVVILGALSGGTGCAVAVHIVATVIIRLLSASFRRILAVAASLVVDGAASCGHFSSRELLLLLIVLVVAIALVCALAKPTVLHSLFSDLIQRLAGLGHIILFCIILCPHFAVTVDFLLEKLLLTQNLSLKLSVLLVEIGQS